MELTKAKSLLASNLIFFFMHVYSFKLWVKFFFWFTKTFFSNINLLLVRSCCINTTHFVFSFSHFYAWNKKNLKMNWVVFLEMMIKVSEFLYTRSMLYFVFNEETVKYTKICLPCELLLKLPVYVYIKLFLPLAFW